MTADTAPTVTIRGVRAESYDRARFIALRQAGYAVGDGTDASPFRPTDRKYLARIIRTHVDRDGSYRFTVKRTNR